MDRRTKIVATVGPASDDVVTLGRMTAAGMDMARLSLAHGPVDEFVSRLERTRRAAAEQGRVVGILADLPGPKIRSGSFPEGGVYLSEGDVVDLVAGDAETTSDAKRTTSPSGSGPSARIRSSTVLPFT